MTKRHLTMSMFATKEDLYKAQRDQLVEQVEELEKASFTYRHAKKAIELFESEYMGQNQTDLWQWATSEAMKNN